MANLNIWSFLILDWLFFSVFLWYNYWICILGFLIRVWDTYSKRFEALEDENGKEKSNNWA